MERLVNKRVLVGITGGIAAYKGAELVRRLKEAGAEVRVAMTGAATQFITQLTLPALSGRPVHLDLLDPMEEGAMGHITLARWADVIVVAPATTAAVAGLLMRGELQGLRVMVTAGPTREAIDPVRYISNRSSGKMGYAIAEAAAEAGAHVVLVSGPTALPSPPRVERVSVENAAEMREAVMTRIHNCDIFIGAAAVADYTAAAAAQKIKKHGAHLTLELSRTDDIVAAVAAASPRPYTVAFAAETEDLLARARQKLVAKRLDLVAANWVGQAGMGFVSDDNALTLVWTDGSVEWPLASKTDLARRLISFIAERYHAQHTS